MTQSNLIKYLDLDKWDNHDDSHYAWQGEIPLDNLPRLLNMADSEQTQQPLQLDLHIKKSGEIILLNVITKGVLWQTCQRCLEPVATSLASDYQLALLKNESHVALLNEDTEYLLLEELTNDNKLYLLEILEDEMLVNLPLSPKHDDCEIHYHQDENSDTVAEEPTKENPFAVLAGLKLS